MQHWWGVQIAELEIHILFWKIDGILGVLDTYGIIMAQQDEPI